MLKLVGLDRGQGHTQLTLQPHLESDLLPGGEKVAKGRRQRSDGISCPEKAAMGVNSLIILATSPVKSENWVNLNLFLDKTQLKDVCLKFCGDLKVYNEITGIQTCTSAHPCYACEARRDPRTGEWIGVPAPLRTHSRNLAHYNEWLAGGGGVDGGRQGLRLAKEHCNVVAEPLLGKSEPDKPLLLLLVPGALHLKLGVVNSALELLKENWDGLEDWLRARGIQYVPYHGVVLEGNECSKVINDLADLELHLPEHLKPFSAYLRAFGAVMSSSFGLVPRESWEEDIVGMKQEFLNLHHLFGLSHTPKLHIIFQHIPDFIRWDYSITTDYNLLICKALGSLTSALNL